jgi:dihydrodipicolinate synthase/N-acetylneuraminate lyase
MDPEAEEASASLGATRWQTFYKVILPTLYPALITGFALAFARSIGEYGSVVFISGNMPMRTEISPLLIMIYNVPGFTGYDIPAEVVVELADHPNIIGMKESGGDVEKIRKMAEATRHVKRSVSVSETFEAVTPRMLKASSGGNGQGGELVQVAGVGGAKPSSAAVTLVNGIKTRQKEVGFQIMAGLAQKLEASLQAGAVGGVLAFADVAPTACYEIYAAWKEGDAELARLKQERIAGAAQRIGGELGIPGMKYGMDLNGYYGGPARLPFLPLTADLKSEVERLLADIRN